ncbi:MAG: sugar ABC transporter ATP-binding protein [Acidobacteriota bacterium]
MLLRAQGISKSFGGNPVLKNITLSFDAGQIHALIGENGAGKSTLMKILAGLYTPDSGSLQLEGHEVQWREPAEAQQAGISLIPQELSIAPHLSVSENVFLGIEQTNWGLIRDDECRSRTRNLIEEYNLDFTPEERVAHLSPSQKQQVEILRSLVRAQKVLILDEPTAYFSDRESERLYRMMRQVKERGLSLIFITHRLEELEGLADWVTVLRDGVCVHSTPAGATNLAEILGLMIGQSAASVFPPKQRVRGRALLRLRQVSLAGYLRDVTLDLHEGEILGLGGFVGSRRSELAEVLFGLHPDYTGEIWFDGNPVRLESPVEALALGFAFVSEDRKRTGIFPHLSVLENVSLVSLPDYERNLLLSSSAEAGSVQDMLKRFKVHCEGTRQLISRLSGGNQQKCILARWMLTRPRLLILDEPTRGIDMGARIELYRWFDRLAGEGYGLFLISSDLRELEGLCDRIAVFREGRLVTVLEDGDVTREKVLRYAALG